MTAIVQYEHNSPVDAAAYVFNVLSAPMRLRIIEVLSVGEKSVVRISTELQSKQSNTSHHLKLLLSSGIVKRRREGARIFYAIADSRVVEVCRVMLSRHI
jgi:DNA-binding transcriptional ArsR family regulator